MRISMRISNWLWVLSLSLVASQPAVAGKLYKWVDDKGNVHYSDRVPPEAAKYAREEKNQEGVTVKKIARAKTKEELAAEAAQRQQEEEARKLVQAQAQADNALLTSYATEDDLIRARDQQLSVIDANIATVRFTIANQEKALSELLANAADFERNQKPIPQHIADSIARVRKQIEAQQEFLAEREAAKESVRKEYEAKLLRWRELSGKQQNSSASAP